MTTTCKYCNGVIAEASAKCPNCGAPALRDASLPDFRTCPRCQRKLLALASPACSYCGERLPDEYIKARTDDLHRVKEISNLTAPEDRTDADQLTNLEDLIRFHPRAAGNRSLFDLGDLVDLTDLFS